jgi:C-terminal processing protease CtpA/Prc
VLAHKHVFLLTGRNTFSAAVLFAAELVDRGHVTVVGEPTGGAPASFGNASDVPMLRTGFVLSVASTREYAVDPHDRRTTIRPDLPVALSSRDYFAGRDPVLTAALDAAP